ncbi:MAG: hypothetical protein ABEJ66_00645 [Candidatus Nanohaloarchaea archaeon]
MRYSRALLLVVMLAVFFEFLVPLFSAKTGYLLPLLKNNCGAVPLFLSQVMDYRSTASTAVWRGFVTCGASFLAFLVLPGVLKFLGFTYRLARPGRKGSDKS